MIFAPCQAADIADVLARVPGAAGTMEPDDFLGAQVKGVSFSGWHEGRVVGCAGIYDVWPGRSAIWSLLPPESGRHMVPITRFVDEILYAYPARRVEATVRPGHAAGERWMKMLRFDFEGRMKAYGPDGGDYDLYARVRP